MLNKGYKSVLQACTNKCKKSAKNAGFFIVSGIEYYYFFYSRYVIIQVGFHLWIKAHTDKQNV